MSYGKQKNKTYDFWYSQKSFKNIEIAKTQGRNSVKIGKPKSNFF